MLKFFAFATFMFLSVTASANTQLGVQALRAGDFQTAYQNFGPAAAAGDANAQYNLCGMFFLGQGVAKNDVEAAKWCQLAAQQGHADAAYNLALFYQKGNGVQQNFTEAMKWYKVAADKGNKDAQFNLLQLYNANKIADQRIRMETTKKVGIVPPLLPNDPSLGVGRNLQNVQQNVPAVKPQTALTQAKAPAPQKLTAEQQQSVAIQKACLEAAQRGIVADNCDFSTPKVAVKAAELAPSNKIVPEAQATEIEHTVGWFEKQADLGDLAAQNNLGVMYRRGKGVPKNPKKAFEIFEKASAKGSPNAMLNLANMYKLGEGVPQNLELSYAWYNLAADRLSAGESKKAALANIKEISGYMTNEQIGSALNYVTKLDETIPLAE